MTEFLASTLSPRAIKWLTKRGAVRDPDRVMAPEGLREQLKRWGLTEVGPMLRFEEVFGGTCVPSAEGEAFWFGLGMQLERGVRPRQGRVAMGAFPHGTYWMDSRGRVVVDDGVVEPFVVAEDARRLFERFAIGQEYPVAAFTWPGRMAVEMTVDIAAELAAAMGAERIDELSDTCQAVFQKDDLALWSPPTFAEMSVAPCTAVVSEIASVRELLAAMREGFPDVGVSVRVAGEKVEERSSVPPPETPAGVRYERWDDVDPTGTVALSNDGGIVQWITTGDEVVVERISRDGFRRVHFRRAEA
ncbi:hypothetical protein BE20_13510 [Sorangium cellulosum]|uniref:Uncharacterized protein n=1 Tax=Sorangium cellulosum TaxID=56 RepID=A0A150SYW6_SORCE|nr:hypothetical protein BE20_13510 [Sorangium cellulosum]KYF97619.1 hypothetical protein BE18_13690 [Sorangium cellulosum]